MNNRGRCIDCHITATRGRMHVRSRSFRQVFWCESCWALRLRLAEITRAVRLGVEVNA